jgi:hypothetical protein
MLPVTTNNGSRAVECEPIVEVTVSSLDEQTNKTTEPAVSDNERLLDLLHR